MDVNTCAVAGGSFPLEEETLTSRARARPHDPNRPTSSFESGHLVEERPISSGSHARVRRETSGETRRARGETRKTRRHARKKPGCLEDVLDYFGRSSRSVPFHQGIISFPALSKKHRRDFRAETSAAPHDSRDSTWMRERKNKVDRSPDLVSVSRRATRSCEPAHLVVVGDRLATDVLFGNLHGMLTVHCPPLDLNGDNRLAASLRALENKFVLPALRILGLKPPAHALLKAAPKAPRPFLRDDASSDV